MYLNKLSLIKGNNFKKRYPTASGLDIKKFNWLISGLISSKWSTIYIKHILYVELKIYKFFLLKLRKFSKKKNFFSFVFLFCNHRFSKKARNARMGKGKGRMLRFVCRKKPFKPIFLFSKISVIRILHFVKYLNKHSKHNFYVFF